MSDPGSPAVERHDLLVIGGGPGGIAAVDAGLRRGASTLVVQDGPMGGDCTFTGCVPSKTLIAAAARGRSPHEALAEVRAAIDRIASMEDADTFRRKGATVIEGRARFVSGDTVEVDGRRHRADAIVVATGAAPVVPPIDGLRESAPLTSETLWDVDALPSSLAVLGGGPIGIELAQAMARLGVRVTVVEAMEQILGREEPETAELVRTALADDGVDVRVGARVERVELVGESRRVHTDTGDAVDADAVLVAIGRRAVTEGLGLDDAGVRVDDRGHIETDDHMATSASGVYAVGDVTGKFPFTHAAHAQGLVAVGNALGRGGWRKFSASTTPFVTFTDPEIARVGMTEAEAFEVHGAAATVVEFPMTALDRAITEGRTEGFVKLIAAPGRILGRRAGGQFVGATVVSPHAGELIHELSLAMRLRIPPAAIAMVTHAYPTWGIAVQQAASGFFMDLEHGTTRPAGGLSERRRPASGR